MRGFELPAEVVAPAPYPLCARLRESMARRWAAPSGAPVLELEPPVGVRSC